MSKRKKGPIPEPLMRTEDAVETIGGLVTLLSYVHEVASPADAAMLHNPVGFLLNTMQREVGRARKGTDKLYDRHFKTSADLTV
jgi:hypothetical protein